jgi:hypothetical protein
MTAGEVLEERGQSDFFIDFTNVQTRKCYGIRLVAEKDVDRERIIGFYGAQTITFVQPFEVMRGPNLIEIKASKKRPVTCVSHLYPLM